MQRRDGLTRRKLEEAAFFLGHLKPNFRKERKFDFYLSAFISAARAVTWAMCAEYKRVPGWKHWYDERKPTTEEARIFKGTTDVRNRTQKAGALRTVSKITVAGLSLPNGDNAQLKSIIARARRDGIAAQISGSGSNYTLKIQVEGQPVILAARKVQMERELAEFPGQDILRICDQYYGMVSQLVTDCEKRFDA